MGNVALAYTDRADGDDFSFGCDPARHIAVGVGYCRTGRCACHVSSVARIARVVRGVNYVSARVLPPIIEILIGVVPRVLCGWRIGIPFRAFILLPDSNDPGVPAGVIERRVLAIDAAVDDPHEHALAILFGGAEFGAEGIEIDRRECQIEIGLLRVPVQRKVFHCRMRGNFHHSFGWSHD